VKNSCKTVALIAFLAVSHDLVAGGLVPLPDQERLANSEKLKALKTGK
jgi:hypothetical protein